MLKRATAAPQSVEWEMSRKWEIEEGSERARAGEVNFRRKREIAVGAIQSVIATATISLWRSLHWCLIIKRNPMNSRPAPGGYEMEKELDNQVASLPPSLLIHESCWLDLNGGRYCSFFVPRPPLRKKEEGN